MGYLLFGVTSPSSTNATTWWYIMASPPEFFSPTTMPGMAAYHDLGARDATFAIYTLCGVGEDDVDRVRKTCDAACEI